PMPRVPGTRKAPGKPRGKKKGDELPQDEGVESSMEGIAQEGTEATAPSAPAEFREEAPVNVAEGRSREETQNDRNGGNERGDGGGSTMAPRPERERPARHENQRRPHDNGDRIDRGDRRENRNERPPARPPQP